MRGLIELKLEFSVDLLGRVRIGDMIVGTIQPPCQPQPQPQPQPIDTVEVELIDGTKILYPKEPQLQLIDRLEVGQQLRTYRGDLVTITDLYRPHNPPIWPPTPEQLNNPNHIHPSPTYPIVGQVEGFILETAWTIEGKLKHATTIPNELDLRLES